MNQAVFVKSFQNGLHVILDDSLPFDEIILEVENKFRESAKFFQEAKLALSIEGRALSLEEEKQIVDTISNASGLTIVCLINKEEQKNQMYLNAVNQIIPSVSSNNFGEFYYGSIKDGNTLESDSSLVIFGDVYPDCSVISAKDIIVLGGLYGQAIAGNDTDSKRSHIVIAMEMSPQKLKIGNLKYRVEKPAKWSIKPKIVPKVACVREEKIVMEILSKETLAKEIL